ncbi:hypothetical protein JCM21714_3492 [Gracilibacillus boraciitolerans JCM 21714]|uniref:Uncharacterized protein n=2 Tax=Gracilibacillus boraciitolerans TaxID=307521 RepID=W4VNJ5_9BACI|nr:hypothetical protein JCM21714_3492 [Gracilibacillus boraciitolerans JCM 21714]
MKIQSELTKRFPSSTTSEYAQLMNLIGNSDRLSLEEKDLVDNILNSFSATNKRQWYKGGSTAFVLTSAMYIQIEKETLALSVFIRDEKRLDLLWIERVIHDFLRSLIKDNAFREQVIQRLEDNQQSEKVVNV